MLHVHVCVVPSFTTFFISLIPNNIELTFPNFSLYNRPQLSDPRLSEIGNDCSIRIFEYKCVFYKQSSVYKCMGFIIRTIHLSEHFYHCLRHIRVWITKALYNLFAYTFCNIRTHDSVLCGQEKPMHLCIL